MIHCWVTLFCIGTVLHKPFWKLHISGMAMEKSKGRTALVFFGIRIYRGTSPETRRVMRIVVVGKWVWKALWKDKEAGSGHVGPFVWGWQHPPASKHVQNSSQELSKALLLASSAYGCSRLLWPWKGWIPAQRSPLPALEAGHPKSPL